MTAPPPSACSSARPRRSGPPSRPGLAALAVAAGLLGGAPPARGQDVCANLPQQTTIVVTPAWPTPVIDGSADFAALKRAARETGAQHGQVTQPLGLTVARRVGEVVTVIAFASTGGRGAGAACGTPQEIRVKVGFEDVTIRIAREVTGNRCLYDQVLQHEGRHVRVDQETVGELVPRLESELRALAGRLRAVRGASAEAVRGEIERRVRQAVDAQLRAHDRENARRQSVIDRPEEYRRVSTVCDGAAAKLIEASRRGGAPVN